MRRRIDRNRRTMLQRLPDQGPCELWRVDLDAAVPAGWMLSLSTDERVRADRFRFPVHRRRFIAGRSALRQLLGDRLGVSPTQLRFRYGESGKPTIAGSPRCAFNLSHSDDAGLIAIAPEGEEIGVDLERVRSMPDAVDLARAHFTARESLSIDALEEPERSRSFLTCWTRKEACLKAIGTGLGIDPRSFHTGIGADEAVLTVPTDAGGTAVRVRSLTVAEGIVAALAWAPGFAPA